MAAADTIEVTLEDQKRLNAFSRLLARMHEFEAQLKAKKKLMDDLEDAENELMLSDEDTIKFVIGDCFVHLDKDAAEARLGAHSEETKADVGALNKQIAEVQGQITELKATLYAKFRDTINLEEY